MTTPKKPAETGLRPGVNDIYMEIFREFKLYDMETNWMKSAKCKGRDDMKWFPEPGESHTVAVTKQFCQDCRVKKRCLEYALNNLIPYGIWGGMSATERKKMLNTTNNNDILGL